MEQQNDLLFFLSCNPDRNEIDKIKKNNKIVSIYHVCGIEPWLIVCKVAHIRDILNLNQKYILNIKYMSIASSQNLGSDKLSHDHNKQISWIFIKGKKLSNCDQFKSFLKKCKDFKITQAYQIFGEYNFILKLYTGGMGDVDKFLISCQEGEENISTSTKCVLTALKDDKERSFGSYKKNKKEVAKKIKDEVNYAIARVMANTNDFIRGGIEVQKETLMHKLSDIGIPTPSNRKIRELLLDPELDEDNYWQYDLEHPNDLIDRYSIKLERGGWLKVLFFFKATPGNKFELENTLINELLGVQRHLFSRKLYHMTGDYDFIVPFDCEDMDTLNKAIDDFLNDHGELIERFTNTVCRPSDGKEQGSLEVLDLPLINALLINATKISTFETKIRSIPSILNKDLSISMDGISPREGYVREAIKDYTPESISTYQKDFTTFDNIGIKSTIEFKNGALIQNLLKFYFANSTNKSNFLDDIQGKIDSCEIVGVIYEPVRNPLTVMCILMVKELVELEVLIDEFEKYCRKIEFHVIFHQRYYSKTIEKKIRCRPCFHPVDPPSQDCGKCIRYLLPRKWGRELNINFEKKLKREIKVILVGIDIGLPLYFALDESLDQEEKRKIIFENYKRFIQTHPKSHYKSYDGILAEYNEIIKERLKYRNNYKEAILKVINDNEFDILLLPEYTIPLNIYDQIKKEMKQISENKRSVIVAGTHIDKDGFNVCPIFVGPGKKYPCERYDLYKNNFSEFEEELGYFFSWDSPEEEYSERLKWFLKDEFDIEWAENATISKSNEIIRITNGENSAEIKIGEVNKIGEVKKKATLKISDGRTHDLKVKEDKNGKLNLYGLGLMKNTGTAHLKFLDTTVGNIYVRICYDAFYRHVGLEDVDVFLVPSFNPAKGYKDAIKGKARDNILVAGYANTINDGGLETDFFCPKRGAVPGDIKPLHKEQWPKGEKIEKVKYRLYEEEKITINGFNFRIKKRGFDIISLDMWREIYSMGTLRITGNL